MNTQQITQAINDFATNLQNSFTMEDKRQSVQWLADKIGSTHANQIAELYGLKGQYYKA